MPQQTAAEMGLELADGVDPLQLSSYVDFMNKADGVPNQGYSVTLPPFRNSIPGIDNELYTPDARRLGILNVQYLAAEYQLDAQGLTLVDRIDTTWIYQNEFARPVPGSNPLLMLTPIHIQRLTNSGLSRIRFS